MYLGVHVVLYALCIVCVSYVSHYWDLGVPALCEIVSAVGSLCCMNIWDICVTGGAKISDGPERWPLEGARCAAAPAAAMPPPSTRETSAERAALAFMAFTLALLLYG